MAGCRNGFCSGDLAHEIKLNFYFSPSHTLSVMASMQLVSYDSSSEDESQATGNGSNGLIALPKINVELSKNVASMDQPYSSRLSTLMTGTAEEIATNDSIFKQQKRMFDSQLESRDTVKTVRHKRAKGDPTVLEGKNAYKGPWAASDDNSDDQSGEKDLDEEESSSSSDEDVNGSLSSAQSDTESNDLDRESSEYVGNEERDYLGRTYMHIPNDLGISLTKEMGSFECFIPKKKIHTWEGHTGGTTKIQFFPNAGHILLSGGNDTKIKLWNVYKDREMLRIFNGHSRAVKDLDFSPDGRRFLSSSYDRKIKLWDTETGQCIFKTAAPAIANAVKFNPNSDKQDEFLAAMSNKKILQYDTRTKEIIQEYDHHLGPVNTVTFVDKNYRFMTTSDDKTIRVWDWGINAPIKFIADPHQHSMPRVCLHPGGKYVAAESMDERILVFGATDRFRPNRKKEFTGLQCAGYAVGLSFSPDGKYLMSGDSTGNACFWDWKTCSMKSKFKAHSKAVLCIEAQPQETSKVATAGLDGVINYWD